VALQAQPEAGGSMAKLMLTDLYNALRAGNIPEEKARAAATAVADFDRRFERIGTRLTVMLSLLGVMLAVMLGGFYALWAQLVAMSAKLSA
jgi:hypothetical protein